jgi:Flp pilus assembly protein TadG
VITRAPVKLRDDDRGSLTLELAVLAPVFLLFLTLLVGGGRVALARSAVQAAARDAARQASIARDPATAQRDAYASAVATLAAEDLQCDPQVNINAAALTRPVGRPSTVTATVTCTMPLSDIALPGLPGAVTEQASAASPVDPYRGRQP